MCTLENFFGNIEDQEDEIKSCDFLEDNLRYVFITEKTYSIFFVILFLMFVIYKKLRDPNYFRNLVHDSVFLLLKDYYNIKYGEGENEILFSQALEDSFYEEKSSNLFDFLKIYPCFFNSYCLNQCISPCLNLLSKCCDPFKRWFWKRSYFILFYMVSFGFIFYSPLEYIFSFLLNPCLNTTATKTIYTCIDFLTTIFSFFCLGFMISFIASRRELQSLPSSDIRSKAFLFYYHIEKGLIFAFIVFLLKLAILIVSIVSGIFQDGNSFFNISLRPVSNIYYLERGVLFFLMIRRSHSKKTVHLNCNCDLIKQQAKFYHIQNFLIKNRINNNLQDFIDYGNKEDFLLNFEIKLKNFVNNKLRIYEKMVEAIEEQNFKNVLVKKNLDSKFHPLLANLFIFYFAFSIILTILIVSSIAEPFRQNCFLKALTVFGYIILDFTEILIFPYLFIKTTKKKNLI